MDRKSRRARKLAASGVTALGLAAALAVTAPTAANAQRADHNCGNFDHHGAVFGAPYDGHHRHRGAVHTAAHHGFGRLDPVDDHDTDGPGDHGRDRDGDHDGDHGTADATDHRDGDHRDGDHRDGDRDGDHRDGDHRDGDHRDGDRDGDHRDGDHRDGDHRDGDRDGDHRGDRDGDHRGDRDNRWDHDGEHRYASDARGNDYVNDGEGNYNCGNFGYHGKQMYVPPGLFDDGDHR